MVRADYGAMMLLRVLLAVLLPTLVACGGGSSGPTSPMAPR